jgi:ABC-type bacteriocin/lantibiotic exporter with double-glycine peptidase domain
MEAVECGAASLAMVLAYFGHHAALADLRLACGVSRDGSSALGIKNAGLRYGLNVQARRAELEGLAEIPTPAVLHWSFNHFVVLERATRRGLTIVDPGFGRQVVTWRDAEELFTGVVLVFSPSESFVTSPPVRASVARYVRTLRSARGGVGVIVASAVLLELGQLVPPAIQQIVVDFVVRPTRSDLLALLVAILASGLAVRLFVTYLRERTVLALEVALDVALKTAFVRHLTSLPLGFFHQRSAGDLLNRVHGNSSVRALTHQAIATFLNGLLVIGYAGLMLLYSWRIAAVVLALSAVRLLIVARSQSVVAQSMSSEVAHGGREAGALIHAVAAPESVKAFGAEEFVLQKYSNALARRLNATLERRALTLRINQIVHVFDGASRALVLWLGGAAVIRDEMTVGVFAAFITLQMLFDAPLEQLLGFFQDYQLLKSILLRIDDVMDAEPEPSGTRSPKGLSPRLEIDRVSFRYGPTTPCTLEDVSLVVHPGETVALVGRSGCGKSTLMALVAGMSSPTSGAVRLDGCDLRTLDLREYRRSIGFVLQDPVFFNDTVRANISLHEPNLPLGHVREAARIACIDDVIRALPDGYETPLGERAARLSGGQRQRLAIARALVHRPSILLLDEATSALDPELQARVVQSLRARHITTLVIAHRLETVRHADRIVVIHEGRVVQQGEYRELAASRGLFRDMVGALA